MSRMPAENMTIDCIFSEDRRYRYVWRTVWDPLLRPCVFIGLNPSTADETKADPTIRRCIKFATRWECGSLTMLNLFAFRSTDPYGLQVQADPVGPENDWVLTNHVKHVTEGCEAVAPGLVICAWGIHGHLRGRADEVLSLLRDYRLHALKLTADGAPGHPLYLRGDSEPFEYRPGSGVGA